MAVDTFIIIRNGHWKGKNALIVAKKVTSIQMPKNKKGPKMKNTSQSTKTENTEIRMKRKFVKVNMNNKEVKFLLDISSDVTLINEPTWKKYSRPTLLKIEKNCTWH